jgi:hypothetical protein
MILFERDEAGYKEWVRRHPTGFVVNHHARPKPHYLILHRATCHTITGVPTRGTTWTTPYVKRCAEQRTELEHWAKSALAATLQPCAFCFRPSRGVSPTVPRE